MGLNQKITGSKKTKELSEEIAFSKIENNIEEITKINWVNYCNKMDIFLFIICYYSTGDSLTYFLS